MKVIALNSGGFDSIILMHFLKEQGYEIISLFFDYGQNNVEQERKCAEKVCEKLEVDGYYITLPTFTWSESSVVKLDRTKSQYIEWRNLIFLSYATSLAESIGVETIFMALIDNNVTEIYKDCSPDFVDRYNSMNLGVKVEAPFIYNFKEELAPLAKKYGISRDDFFSCNLPTLSGEPCQKCGDCVGIEEIYDIFFVNRDAEEAWVEAGYMTTPEFAELYKNGKLKSLKIYINDGCQFNCTHCFLNGINMKGELLSPTRIIDLLEQAIEMGLEELDFMGKEPLIDETIFDYLTFLHLQEKKPNINIVTNGVNVEKYIDLLEITKPNIVLSVAPVGRAERLRDEDLHIPDTITLLQERGIPFEITVDVDRNNYSDAVNTIITLKQQRGVNRFYVKTLVPCGQNSKEIKEQRMSKEEYDDFFHQLLRIEEDDLLIRLSMNMEEFYIFASEIPDIRELLDFCDTFKTGRLTNNLLLIPERFCNCSECLTISSDGYAFKCGFFLSFKDYQKKSVGNFKDKSLSELFERSKKKSEKEIEVCPFTKIYLKKNVDKIN